MSLQSILARVKLWDGTNQASVTASNALKVDGSAVTQPISAASLPSHNVTNAGTFAVQATQSGTWTVQPGNTANTTAWKVDGSAVTQPVSGTVTANVGAGNLAGITAVVHVDDNSGSLTVDGTVTANAGTGTFTNQQSNITTDYDTGAGTQTTTMFGVALPASGGAVAGGTATNPIRTDPTGTTTQPVSGTVTSNIGTGNLAGITAVVHVDDNSGSLTVDNAGTFAVQAAQSGTWTVQPGNTANTTAWKVDGSAVTQPVGGNVAHDGVDAGNPVKVGGKVSTTVPTPVSATADRTDAWFDEYGRVVVNDSDIELGVTSGTTGLRERLVAQRYTVLADSLADGIAGFWTQTTASGGAIASTSGEGQLTTSTATTGSIQIVSPSIPYTPGEVAWLNSAVRFGDTGTAGDIRRIGMFTVSGTTPQDGFYYELNGTTLNAVVVKAATPTATAAASWSRNGVAPFTLDTNYHAFEIRYTANSVWFYIDNVLRHVVTGTSAALTTSLTLPITVTNVKTSGATNITLAIRNIGNGRFGDPSGVVTETGLQALNAATVGGATPHDSVDSGNPVKIGGYARAAAPTAVADGDRVNAWFTTTGALNVARAGSTTSAVTQVASSATSVTLLAANTGRRGATIYNDSTQAVFVKFGTTASATSFTIKMAAASYYETPFDYTGRIDGIWVSANGNAYVTEITA